MLKRIISLIVTITFISTLAPAPSAFALWPKATGEGNAAGEVGKALAPYRSEATGSALAGGKSAKYPTKESAEKALAERVEHGLANNPAALVKPPSEGGDQALYNAAREFSITLPAKSSVVRVVVSATGAAAAEATGAATGAAELRLKAAQRVALVVDPDIGRRDEVVKMLEEFGFASAIGVASLKEARAYIEAADLIINNTGAPNEVVQQLLGIANAGGIITLIGLDNEAAKAGIAAWLGTQA